MIKQILFLALAATCVSAIPFRDCGSTSKVHELRIEGCDAEPCVFTRGSTYMIEMNVTARTPHPVLPLRITGHPPIIAPITVWVGNACLFLIQGTCPAVPGNFFTARIAYVVSNILPAVTLPVRFTVTDAGVTPVCGEIMARITG